MNSANNFRDYSYSYADSTNGEYVANTTSSVTPNMVSSHTNENEYCTHSYGLSIEKRSDCEGISNDNSTLQSTSNSNMMGKGGYATNGTKINIICTNNRNCSELSINEKNTKMSEMTSSSNMKQNRGVNNSVKLYKNIDMSFIYNKYDKNGLIYCKAIKFLVKCETKHNYVKTLTVKINSMKNIGGKQYMRLELSDDMNESFFYYLDLYEENYEKIKKEQTLVINFDLFPFKFIDLLEECVLESEHCEKVEDQRLRAVLILDSSNKTADREGNNYTNNGNDSGGKMASYNPYYNSHPNSATYNSGINSNNNNSNNSSNLNYCRPYACTSSMEEKTAEIAILNIVEINQFKELTHLSLQLRRADYENVITYLCNNLKYVKEYNEEMITKVNEEIIKNNNNMIEIKNLQKTIENLENSMNNMKCDFNLTLSNDINNLKKEHEKIIERREEKFTCENEELKKDLENLKNKFNQLNEINENHEKKIFNLNSKVKNLKTELEEKNTNFVKLMKEKEDIECAKCELEKYKNTFTVEFNNLKTKYEKECESNISNSSSFESIKMSNYNLEMELKKYKDRNVKLEKEINVAIDEINKGNDIITKLQNQLKKMKDKLKSKTIEHVNIEKISSQNINEITKLHNEVKTLHAKLGERDSAEETLRKEIDNLKRRNDEMAKELSISREVNLRLNKEITNNNLDTYAAKLNMGVPPNVMPGANFRVDTNLLDKDLFTKLKANLKNSNPTGPMPAYAMEGKMNLNLMNGKIDTLDINDRYNKPVKFIPPGI
ncbi:spindle assembly abnormal protein 6 [Plasmodium gonderi]|uniref:Spindle assembly abnormal protein 6 n=1 Tax=Plasmodium gonderi TaxID=77519 RepID=A0A1Y1JKH6_PLAGO|nr:spindle assembly abnormal protein 6 [Plasmodium gonderi]GAW81945.1 spindle assembly abnormal protein 6 [Plasmodium gonderi]